MTKATPKKLALALEWAAANEALQLAKTRELELRGQVVKACFEEDLVSGTTNLVLDRGYTLKANRRPSTKITDMIKFKAAIATLLKTGKVGKLLVTRLLKWTPEVSLSEFKKLSAEHAVIFKEAVEIALGSPSLELTKD